MGHKYSRRTNSLDDSLVQIQSSTKSARPTTQLLAHFDPIGFNSEEVIECSPFKTSHHPEVSLLTKHGYPPGFTNTHVFPVGPVPLSFDKKQFLTFTINSCNGFITSLTYLMRNYCPDGPLEVKLVILKKTTLSQEEFKPCIEINLPCHGRQTAGTHCLPFDFPPLFIEQEQSVQFQIYFYGTTSTETIWADLVSSYASSREHAALSGLRCFGIQNNFYDLRNKVILLFSVGSFSHFLLPKDLIFLIALRLWDLRRIPE